MSKQPSKKSEACPASNERRALLKRAAYTAPALVALGLLVPKGNAAGFGSPGDGPKSEPGQRPTRRKPGTG